MSAERTRRIRRKAANPEGRRRKRRLGAALVAALLVAGCGGGTREPAGPRLPRAVAQSLAARADRLAVLYARGSCSAVNGALAVLQRAAIAEVNAHRVPAAFQEELLSAVNALPSRTCPARAARRAPAPAARPEPKPKPAPAPKPHGKAKGHGKHEAKHGNGEGKGKAKGEGKGKGKHGR